MARGLSALLLVGMVMIVGCEQKPSERAPSKVTSEDVRRDAAQAVDTVAEFSEQTKDGFQKRLEAQLEELDGKIVALREKGRDLKDQAKANWDQKMVDLETKRDTARAKLAAIGESSAETWKDVRQGAQSAWDELEHAFQDVSREF